MQEYQNIFKSVLGEGESLELWNLASIFERLSIEKNHAKGDLKTYFYKEGSLPDFANIDTKKPNDLQGLEDTFFPKRHKSENVSILFKDDYELLKDDSEDNYTTYHFINKHFSRVTNKENDVVSLFDKYRIQQAKENLSGASQYLLVKGDFSGMQKFIYGGIKTDEAGGTKGLSKKLRGRSFYISVMADMVAETFAEELGLGISNVIYSGGGHFLLLCEDTKENKQKISELTTNINDFLLNNVGSSLSFITGQASCGLEIFDDASKAMMAVNHDLGGKKYKQHAANWETVFNIDKEPNFRHDSLLGDKLPKIKVILELTFEKSWTEDMEKEYQSLIAEEDVVLEFGTFRKLLIMTNKESIYDSKKLFKTYPNVIKKMKIIRINENDTFLKGYETLRKEAKSRKIDLSMGFRYIGNNTPFSKENKYKIADFKEIIKLNNFDKASSFEAIKYTEKDKDKVSFQPWGKAFTENTLYQNYHGQPLSYPKLAVMRLDVDNLGTIFSFGMGEKASLAKTATLSRELHLFFTGYFSVLAKKYDIYITYSGGDDAFVVGSWIGIAHFAKELYHQFKRFVCNNNEITFSAGVFLCDEHYPVAKFANDAADLEKRAKDYPNKNAITIFDHTLSFPQYDIMLNFAVNMLKHVRTDDEKADKDKIARSMVHRILRIIKSCIKEDGGVIKTDKLYRQTANLHYLFARHGYNEKEISEKTKEITKDIMEIILRHFKDEDYNCLVPNFLIPTHYVTLLTRKAK